MKNNLHCGKSESKIDGNSINGVSWSTFFYFAIDPIVRGAREYNEKNRFKGIDLVRTYEKKTLDFTDFPWNPSSKT